MPYTVFALKWRPQIFDEIIGQDHVASTLRSSLEKSRLANAYLFCGPRGVGKTSTARILAKALNCKDGPTVSPCGKCASCLEIAKGTSLDVIEIDGASNRLIDDVRTLRENVKFAPTQGKFKIYIIDEVHMLTNEAFNALLKTLEEPPPFVKFIFATTHPQKIPSTILSRCQRLDFRRISAKEMIEQLKKISRSEKITVDEDVLFAIAKASDGSLRDAESILDQLASFAQGKVSLKDAVSVLGLIEQEALFDIADKIIQKNALAALQILDNILNEGKDISVFLNNLIEHFRNLMVAKISPADSALIDLPKEVLDRLSQQAAALSLDEIFAYFNILVGAQETGKRLDSLRIPLEIALVKLASDKKAQASVSQPAAAPKNNPPEAPRPAKPVTPPVENKKEEEPPKEPNTILSITIEDIKNAWQNIADGLSKVKMYLATYLNEGTPLKLEKNTLTISFPRDCSLHKETLEERDNRQLIEKTFADSLNCNLRVNFVLSKEARQEPVQDDPALKSALNAFGARFIKEI